MVSTHFSVTIVKASQNPSVVANPLQSIYVEPDFFTQPVQKEDRDKVFSFKEQKAVHSFLFL